MRKQKWFGLLMAACITGTASAEIALKDVGEIAGTWMLEAVAPSLKGAKIEENRTWEFRTDGKIVTSGYNSKLRAEDRYEWNYSIENGVIAADAPGRPGKKITYSVYEKDDNHMILKGGLEGFYFFKKNQ